MGGIDMVRMLHRFTGLVFAGLTFLHLYVGITGILFRKWQPSIAVSKNDFTDAIHNIKYYLGMKNHPALCGHYNYVQKFEYWNVLIAGFLMIASGLVLIFPLFVTRFLPGEIIPAAKLLHSNEALLVLLIIAIWHIYNAIFSPEVFPLNSSIFTGYISRQRMVREHPLELAKIEGKPVEEIILHEYDEAPEPLVQN
jgi:cytochrome b subunit of formate dehydrogenase